MNKNTFKPIPPFRGWVLENFPFIEEDFDAITDYQLYCKIVEYIKKIANSQNEVVNNMNTLNSSFIELTNYINNYFENLDIQSEVDSKLDEMAESGQLTDIIAQYLQLAGILAYNTVDDLSNAENLNNGSFAKTYGKETYNDGYGAFYKVRQILNTDVIDGDEIVALVNYPTLIAEKMHDAVIDELINSIPDFDEKIGELDEKIGELDEKIGELDNLETTAKSDLVSALNEVNSNCDNNTEDITDLINKFNFTTSGYNKNVMTSSNCSVDNANINISKNSDGKIIQISGFLQVTPATNNEIKVTIPNTGITPSSDINTSYGGFCNDYGANLTLACTYTFKTDGSLVINIPQYGTAQEFFILFPFTYFI